MPVNRFRGGVCFQDGAWRVVCELNGVRFESEQTYATEYAAESAYMAIRPTVLAALTSTGGKIVLNAGGYREVG